ncbi:MAG: N-acetylneuraminate synthase [Methanothrix sp.]|nr:N-acetylneuraminate synthase [Methanothrix sp.]
MNQIEIDGRYVGEGKSCFIIAEAGVNHNGSLDCAKKLIDTAKWAGADAVKFQIFKAEDIAIPQAKKAEYQKNTTSRDESQFDMIKRLELSEDEFRHLANYAKERNILFLSTPFSISSVNLLEEMNVSAYKIASGEITNYPLLEHIARKGKPIILSTGMCTLEEIGEALKIINEAGEKRVILLHCVTSYPVKIDEINLKAIETIRNAFKQPVGLSDHTLGKTSSIAAVAMGACTIEKHFTLCRNLPGPDHKASLEPIELKELIGAIRDVERAMGNGIKKPTLEEEKIKMTVRKSLVAAIEIPKDSKITQEMIGIKRPGTGIAPKNLMSVIGKRAKIDIQKDSLITWDAIAE